MTNIINLPVRNSSEQALAIVIPLDTVERMSEVLIQMEAANHLAQAVLAKAAAHGEREVLTAVRSIYQALAALVA